MAPRKERKWIDGELYIECRGESNHPELVHESEFGTFINKKGEKVYKSICKKCDVLKRLMDKKKDFIKYKVRAAIDRSKSRKGLARIVDPDLYEQVTELFEKRKGICAITNEPMLLIIGDDKSLSIDRIDHKLGYVRGNIQLVQERVNKFKGQLERIHVHPLGININWPLIISQVFNLKFIKNQEKIPSGTKISSYMYVSGIDTGKIESFTLSMPVKVFKFKQTIGRSYRIS